MQQKSTKFTKISELYKVIIHKVLSQTVLIYPKYIYYSQKTIEIFLAQKIMQKN